MSCSGLKVKALHLSHDEAQISAKFKALYDSAPTYLPSPTASPTPSPALTPAAPTHTHTPTHSGRFQPIRLSPGSGPLSAALLPLPFAQPVPPDRQGPDEESLPPKKPPLGPQFSDK